MQMITLKKRLWLLGGVLWFSAAGLVAWGIFVPCSIGSSEENTKTISSKQSKLPLVHQDDVPSLDQFASVWSVQLQRPLYDPPPKPVVAPPKPKPKPLKVKLLGTMLESDRPSAMFSVPPSSITIREVGQIIDSPGGPAKVLEVGAKRVVLEYAGEKRVLTL